MRRIGVLAVAVVLSACSGGDDVAPTSVAPTRAAPTSAAPASTVAATVAATAAPPTTAAPTEELARLPSAECCLGTPAEPGRYGVAPAMSVQFAFELGEGWSAIGEPGADEFSLVAGGVNDVDHALWWISFFDLGPGRDTAAFLEEVRATPGLEAGPAESTTLAGVDALQVDAEAPPTGETGGGDRAPDTLSLQAVAELQPGTFWYTESAPATLRFLTLQGDPGALFVYLEAPSEAWEDFLTQVQPVLDSIELLDG